MRRGRDVGAFPEYRVHGGFEFVEGLEGAREARE